MFNFLRTRQIVSPMISDIVHLFLGLFAIFIFFEMSITRYTCRIIQVTSFFLTEPWWFFFQGIFLYHPRC